jgi:hypothetical protein
MRGAVSLIFFLFLFDAIQAQKVIISGEEAARPLRWSDFSGKPDHNSPFFAYTWWNMDYSFTGARFSGDAATLEGFSVTLKLDPQNSWLKPGKESDELLKHEQGHFDVGLLCVKEFLERVKTASFSRTGYKTELQEIANSTLQKYKAMGEQYDRETNHSKSRDAQQKWNAFFAESLRSL